MTPTCNPDNIIIAPFHADIGATPGASKSPPCRSPGVSGGLLKPITFRGNILANQITPETLQTVIDLLKANGYERALKKTSTDCIVRGIDADDFTYSVVSLFMTYILRGSMASFNDPIMKAKVLNKNMGAIISILTAIGHELGGELGAEVAAAEKAKGEAYDAEHPNGGKPDPTDLGATNLAGTKH